jgi:hypothetical protein
MRHLPIHSVHSVLVPSVPSVPSIHSVPFLCLRVSGSSVFVFVWILKHPLFDGKLLHHKRSIPIGSWPLAVDSAKVTRPMLMTGVESPTGWGARTRNC